MKKSKILSMLLFGLYFLIFIFGIRVEALELNEEPIDNVWYFRKGGGKKAFSAQFKYYDIDGKTTYCIEPGEHITTHDYEETDLIDSPYSDEINDLIGLIGYYGYDYTGHNTLKFRMATQALIWEVTGGQTVEYWTEPSGAGTFISVANEKNEIMNLVNSHPSLPSFSGQKLDGYINNASTFTDTSNNLSYFDVSISEDYSYLKNGNTLKIYPKKLGLIEVKLQRKTYTNNLTTLFVGKDVKTQTMGYFGLSQNDKFSIYVNSTGGTISLKKVDSYNFNSIPRGDAKLEGTIYGVYDSSGKEVSQIVIGSDGTGKSGALGLGIYTVKEIKAGTGYQIDTATHNFTISKSNLNPSKKVTEWAISSTIEMYKVLNDRKTGVLKPEANIKFEIYLKRNGLLYATITTDENGYASTFLPYGKYVVKQVNTTPGYEKAKDFEFDVIESGYIRKIIADGISDGAKLKVIKKDLDTNNIIKKDGILFKIKNIDTDEYVCQNISYPESKQICEYETKDGIFITPDNLPYGNYELEEVEQTIDGYLWNNKKVSFTIDGNSNYIYDEDFGNILEISFYNKEVKGSLKLDKIGEKMVIDDDGYHYEDILLDNVSFELYAGEDIYSGDGTLMHDKDTLIKTFTTKDGTYTIDNLYLGNYYIKEISNSEEYELMSSPFYFDINYIDENTPIANVKIDLKNYLKKGSFELLKVDKYTNDPIANTIIEVYTIDNDLIYSSKTDEFGKITLKDLAYGKYYYIEKEASTGYQLDNNKYYFEINENDEVISVILANEKEEIPVEDVPNEVIIEEAPSDISEEVIIEEMPVPNTYSNGVKPLDISGIMLIILGILCQRKRY